MTNNNYSNSSTFLGKLNEPNSFEINGLPPQNLAAEEAVLGGILLDPDALNRVISNLNPEAFYVTPHQIIYKTFLDLHKQGKSADLMNVATFLEDNRLIEDVGGRAKLAQLVDRTVSAHNIQELADLIIEKYHRRQIINLSSELSKLGHAGHLSWPEVIKEAENKALQLAAYRKCGKNYQHAAAEAELQKITKELEEVEAIPDEFRKKLAIRTLTKQYGLKTEKEFKDLHAKWLSSANKATR
jgi:replicative DNA helicase